MFEKPKKKRKPRILMVEDYPQNRDMYQTLYEESGFEVIILEHADGAFIDIVLEKQPDLITMDLMLGINGAPAEREGFDAIEALKGDMRTAHIPVFVLSSFSNAKNVERAKELGATDYINKAGVHPTEVPRLLMKFLENPKGYEPVHSLMR